MSGTALRALAGVIVIGLAVLLYVVLEDSGDEERASSAASGVPVVVVVEGGEPKGGIQELTYNAGEPIRFRVESDVADEVHFHGYDVGKEVAAGGAVSFEVPATIPGIFEVELEESGQQIAEVTVEP